LELSLALSDLDLADAISQARQLDTLALGKIYDHYYPQIYRYTVFRLGDEQASQEVIAQVFDRFIEILQKRRKSIDDLPGWLHEATRQLVDDHLNLTNKNPDQKQKGDNTLAQPDHEPVDNEITWLRHLVSKSLQRLLPDQQHLLALRFAESCSPEETARLMGININDVKFIQFDALLSLRRLLEQEA
jgi:RNA polymerase sigma-70 factor, ECF subfamily